MLPARLDAQLRRAVEETGERLRALGHAVEVRDPEFTVGAGTRSSPATCAGIAEDVARVPRPDRLQRRTRGFGRLGQARPRQRRWSGPSATPRSTRSASTGSLREFDVLVTPTTGKPPVGAAEWEGMSALATLLGDADLSLHRDLESHRPAVVLGAGTNAATGLPLGVQLVGRPDGEETLLSLAAQLEARARLARSPAAALLSRA